MIAACQAQVPDLTTEELIFFLREKGGVVRSSSSVENPTGFLLKVVPRCFEGDLFSEWRKQREVEERAAAVEFGKQAAAAAIHEELDAAPANNFWTQIKSSLRQIVNPHTFDWLVPLRYLRLEAGNLLVWMPGEDSWCPALGFGNKSLPPFMTWLCPLCRFSLSLTNSCQNSAEFEMIEHSPPSGRTDQRVLAIGPVFIIYSDTSERIRRIP